MNLVYENLYQVSTYVPPIDLSFNQYLLKGEQPLLVHTGSAQQAPMLLSKLKEELGAQKLSFIFISHFESDECAGLSLILKEYPEAIVLCSEITKRQFDGFGIEINAKVVKPNDTFASDSYDLEFISYPSEMHLWEGLLVFERKRKIFFSSDLMMNFGKSEGQVIKRDWHLEVEHINEMQVPDPEKRALLKETLLKLNPAFIATGHGPCLDLQKENISEKLREVIQTPPDAAFTIITTGKTGAHAINSWNSYIRISKNQELVVPVGRMHQTEENLRTNSEVILTISNREVQGLSYKGTGFLIQGHATMITSGENYDLIKENSPWARAALVISIFSLEQTL